MNKIKNKNGYTLIEMLVVVAIILIIVPAIFLSIRSLYKTHASTLSKAFAVTETTNGVEAIVKDVRSAIYSENGALPLVEISTSTLTLYSDTDMDGKVEYVTYFLDGTTVYKGVIEPTATPSYPPANEVDEVLTTNIVNNSTQPLFRYYTSTSTEITSPSNILLVRRVLIDFIGSYQISGETSLVEVQSSASIRNLKDSY